MDGNQFRYRVESILFLVIAIVSFLWGVFWGIGCLSLIFLIDLIPKAEKWGLPDGRTFVGSIHWRFHGTWLGLWAAIVFGGWVFFSPVERFYLWALLLIPVFFIEVMICYWLPIISYRWVHLSHEGGRIYRFLLLGTWWGDGLCIRPGEPDGLELELSCEVARVHVSMRPDTGKRGFVEILEDNTLIGVFPKIEGVQLEHFRLPDLKSESVNAVAP
jgi:hypothetical protein